MPAEEMIDKNVEPASVQQNYSFRFYGDGGEYFRIWTVNLALTVLTLGIYSAWAKVRTNRYFYGNTELDGDVFEYHAEPMQILKGRLIAIGALILYTIAQTFFPLVNLIFIAILVVFIPFIVVRSLRFRAVMSSWRGVRFGFQGSMMGAAQTYIFWPIFGLLTLGFGMPHVWYKQNQYTVGNHLFGASEAESTTTSSKFYSIFWTVLGLSIVGLIFLGIAAGLVGLVAGGFSDGADGGQPLLLVALIYVGYGLLYVLLYAVSQAMNYRLVYNSIELESTKVRSDVDTRDWARIVLVNSILILATLGIYYPWARVRLSHYMAEHTWVESAGLSDFVSRTGDDESALGEELGEAFDFGIGV